MTPAAPEYPVVSLPDDIDEQLEPMGTKKKFWFELDGRRGLFKHRTRTQHMSGEDWSEKVASELARLVGVPAASCDLAEHRGKPGVVSWSILPGESTELVAGNEVLCRMDPAYPTKGSIEIDRSVAMHTVDRILDACSLVDPPPGFPCSDGIREGAEVVVGFLMFDGWIGNTDRHHQNWAWVWSPDAKRPWLAPSFDHGSSLGHELLDATRHRRLCDPSPSGGLDGYLYRGLAPIWGGAAGVRQLRPIEAFHEAARLRPEAARAWILKLRRVPVDAIDEVVDRVPRDRMTKTTSEFCRTLLRATRRRLLDATPPIRS